MKAVAPKMIEAGSRGPKVEILVRGTRMIICKSTNPTNLHMNEEIINKFNDLIMYLFADLIFVYLSFLRCARVW